MDFTEKDASAFARLRLGKKAQVRETRRSLEKRSRHLMEQSALLKHDIDTFKNELAAIGIQNYLTGVAHVCACSPLCPAVWSMLPVELLQLIFSCLPLPDIIRLRVLSKTWDRYVTGVTPGFTKLCAERNPNMFALVSEAWSDYDSDNGPVDVKLYDSKENRWHEFVHETFAPETCEKMLAGDGGLVCLVSIAPVKEKFPLNIVVFNPLTRQWRELPSLSSLSRIQPRMVQLVMDQDSKCYKVLVVGPKKERGGDAVARIFSSVTGKWSKPNIFSDLIFGCQYSWKSYGPGNQNVEKVEVGPCAYDCASSTLLELDDDSYPRSFGVSSVLVKDRLFVLHTNDNDEYLLNEYQAQSCQPHWIRLKQHQCYGLDGISDYQRDVELETHIFGCQDFLVVNAYEDDDDDNDDDYLHKQTLLFDLSTSQWQIISQIPEWSPHDPADDMFELRWDAVP